MGIPRYDTLSVVDSEREHDTLTRLETTQTVEDSDDGAEGLSSTAMFCSSPGSMLDGSSHSVQHTLTVDEAMDRLGMGRFQGIILIAAGMCFASDAMQVILLTFLCQILRVKWELSTHETALITSILFVGAIFGTLFLGPLADKRGRKPIFILTGSIISFFGLAVSQCTTYRILLGMIFMVGFGVGGLTVPFDILAEFVPSDSRGKNLLIIEYFWTAGVLYVVMMANFVWGNNNGHDDNEGDSTSGSSWRFFVCISTLPCLISVVVGILYVPESPRWLCTVGRNEEALHILRTAAVINGHDVNVIFPEGIELTEETKEEAGFCELFSPKWRWTTAMLWGTWGTFTFGYYGVIMLITEIFENGQGGGGDTTTTDDVLSSPRKYNFDFGAILVSSSAELVGTTLAILAVDRIGRIQIQIASYAAAALSVCALAFMASQESDRSILIVLGFLARIFEMSGTCVTWISTAEILTTEVRTTGHSAANAVARIGAFFAPFLMVGDGSVMKKGIVMLIMHCVTISCVSQLPETKGRHFGVLSTNVDDQSLPETDGHEIS